MKNNRKVFSSYFKDMASQKKHALEQESLKDPFLSDALDGYQDHPNALHGLNKLDKRYYRGRNRIWKTSIIVAIPLLLLLTYQMSRPDHTTERPRVLAKNHSTTILIKPIPSNKIQSFIAIPVEKQLLPQKIQKEFKEKDKGMVFRTNEHPDFPSDEIVQIPLHKIDKLERIPLKSRANFAMETYVQDLKVLDYRYYRKKVRQEKSSLLTGTPAAQETPHSDAEDKEFWEYSYMNFLSGNLHDFNQGEYKAALIGLDQILGAYPDDVNALFYSALCLYNLKQFSLCEQRLNVIHLAKFDNFDEEQQWYLLLCYKALGKSQEFSTLKQSIVQSKGFYSSKAAGIAF